MNQQSVKKKLCMLGAASVGKTSLVRQFVDGIFSDRYLTTIGVRIDKKHLEVDGRDVEVLLWDLSGEDAYNKVSMSYLRGAAGYLLVVDGTRKSTLETARVLKKRVDESVGAIPFVLVLNKSDLKPSWDTDQESVGLLASAGVGIVETSAKTGDGVEDAFRTLGAKLVEGT